MHLRPHSLSCVSRSDTPSRENRAAVRAAVRIEATLSSSRHCLGLSSSLDIVAADRYVCILSCLLFRSLLLVWRFGTLISHGPGTRVRRPCRRLTNLLHVLVHVLVDFQRSSHCRSTPCIRSLSEPPKTLRYQDPQRST